ncbi:hypothetical protein GCM10023189_40360 [Nibrella saemangeumensis]|uniref:Sulfatase N-terminal domain-containing protein n=1 Tax=Nibrella saemangeumensis TaxID=1084526 RepID=A0ABP8NB21_9BACT
MGDKAAAFIRQHQDRPFFLYLPFTIPHASLQAPDAAVAEYRDRFPETLYHGQQNYAATPYPRATYAAMITYMDKKVGEVMALLKELNLDDHTLVLFTSDNGTTFNGGVDAAFFESVGPFRGLKMDVFEGGIRMPMIARWPGKIAPGRVTNHLGAHYDILATLVDVVKAKPVKTDGISFLPTLLGQVAKQKKHEYLYWEYPEKGGQVAIRMGNWKGVKVNMKTNKAARWELYDLEKDKSETTNLASKYPAIIAKFDNIVWKEHQPSHVPEWEFIR